MAKRALVIRSGYDSLDRFDGFENAAECVAQLLVQPRFAFSVCRCEGAAATRDGILQALRALINCAQPHDAIVIYYVGHGASTTNEAYGPDDVLPAAIQNFCPTDYEATTEEDFRGVSMFEISLLIDELTKRTKNVTVILDCCFASMMVRSAAFEVAPSAPKLTRLGLIRHLQSLGPRLHRGSLEPLGNPYAVRVVACDQNGAALPVMLPDALQVAALGFSLPADGWITAFTIRLAEVLVHMADERVSWRAIGAELRSRMVVQRPEIEGPELRVPFTLATVSPYAITVRSDGAMALFDAGRLHGVSVGDVYGVMPDSASKLDERTSLGTVRVTSTSVIAASGPWSGWTPAAPTIPLGAIALPISLAFERVPIKVVASSAVRRAIVAALETSARVRPAQDLECYALAEIRCQDDALELRDAAGAELLRGRYIDGLQEVLRIIERLATIHRLRALPNQHGLAPDEIAVSLLEVSRGERRRLPHHGASVCLTDRVAMQLVNQTDQLRYANVFNIGLRGAITRLNIQSSGIPIAARATAFIGDAIDGSLPGLRPEWPRGLSRDLPRLDTILVAITDAPADLSMLESRDELGGPRGDLSPLQALADQLSSGRPRAAAPGDAFALIWLNYTLLPSENSAAPRSSIRLITAGR